METAASGAEGLIQVVLLLFSGPAGPILAVLLALLGIVFAAQGLPGPTP